MVLCVFSDILHTSCIFWHPTYQCRVAEYPGLYSQKVSCILQHAIVCIFQHPIHQRRAADRDIGWVPCVVLSESPMYSTAWYCMYFLTPYIPAQGSWSRHRLSTIGCTRCCIPAIVPWPSSCVSFTDNRCGACVCVCVCTCVCVRVCVSVLLIAPQAQYQRPCCIYLYVFIYIYVYMYECIYVYMASLLY